MNISLILFIISSLNWNCGLSYNFGSWDDWPGSGLKVDAQSGFYGDYIGIGFSLTGSLFSFSNQDTHFTFIGAAASLEPNFAFGPTIPIKIGPLIDYNVLWTNLMEDGDIYTPSSKVLYNPGYGAHVSFAYPISRKINLGIKGTYKTIYGFKNLNLFSLGLLLEYNPSPGTPRLIADTYFDDSEKNDNGLLDANEKAYIVINLENSGNGAARNVNISISSADRDFKNRVDGVNKNYSISYLKPGSKKKIKCPIEAGSNIPEGSYRVNITCKSKFGYTCSDYLTINTRRGEKPYLTFDVTPIDDNNDEVFDAGERAIFRYKIKNSGRGEAFKVRAKLSGPVNKDLLIGSINPAETKEIDIDFQMPLNTKTGRTEFVIGLDEVGGYAPEDRIVIINTRAQASIAFRTTELIDDDMTDASKGDNQGDVDKGETIEHIITVYNDGSGIARRVKMRLSSDQRGVEFDTPDAELGNINPYGSKSAILVFTVRQEFSYNKVRLNLEVSEQTGKFAFVKPLEYELGKPPTLPPVAGGGTRRNAFALIVGISNYYSSSVQKLSFFESDAREVYRLFSDPAIGNLPIENIRVHFGEKATLSNIRASFAEISEITNESSYVYIFLAGHGAPSMTVQNQKVGPFFLPYDARMGSSPAISASAISTSELKDAINEIRAKGIMLIVNACYSQVPIGTAAGVSGEVVKPAPMAEGKGRIVIYATRHDQFAHEHPDLRHSIFGYYFIEALEGKADINRDETISVQEIWNYVKDKVNADALRLKSQPQQPQIEGEGDFEVGRCR